KANELPLNGRNIFNLITISPAAVAQGGSGGTPVGQNPFSWGNYQVGGSFANESAEYLDGQPLNIGYINLPIVIPTQDSVGEFKVQYNNLGPEFGKFSGGIIKDKTFFFVSWEQFRLRTGGVVTTTVPIQAFRQGDFSALLAQGIQLYDPYS